MFHRIIGHGMWGGALVSAVLGTRLPGPGTIYLGQDLQFRKPVGVGDTITVTVTAKEKRPEKHVVIFDCHCTNQNGDEVITGTAVTMAPTEKIRRPRVPLPEVQLRRHDRYQELITLCRALEPIRTAVVHPCDQVSLEGAVRRRRGTPHHSRPRRSGGKDPVGRCRARHRYFRIRDRQHRTQPCRRRQGRRPCARRQRGSADEGQSSYRRADA